AGQIAALDMATNGRAYLGLVRGAWLDALGLEQGRPVEHLREAAQFVQHVLARREEAFDGQFFYLAAGAALRYAPLRTAVPLITGPWGGRTARVAQDVAEEIKVGGSANPAMVGYLREAPTLPMCLGAVTVIDSDAQAARHKARKELALSLPVVARLDRTLD